MSGSVGKSKNNSSNNANFSANQDVWGPNGEALQQLYGNIGNLFSQGQPGLAQQGQQGIANQQNMFNAQQPAWQNQMQGGAYADMGLQNNLMDSLNRSQRSPSAMQDINSMIMGGDGNNYADAMKNQYVSDANRAQQNMLGNLDARAAASGMSGGARQGVAQARGMEDINRNLQRNMANTGFSSFDKDLDRKLQIAQQADQNTFGRQQMMSDMIGNQQNAMQGGLQYGNTLFGQGGMQQQTPWDIAQSYGSTIGGPTVLTNTSGVSSGGSSGKGFGLSGGK